MDFSVINWLAVALAAIAAMVVGAIWYGPLFAKPWQTASGVSDEQLRTGAVRAYVLALLAAVVMAVVLAPFIARGGVAFGAIAGLAVGLGWVAMSFGMVTLFERRPFGYWAIIGGYAVVSYTAMGAIIGALQA
jgi:hypothetical protein